MKVYKVTTGYGTDEYGYSNHKEIAKYFLDETAARALCKTGEVTRKETKITTTFKDGTTVVATTGAKYYENRKKDARPNEKVELVEIVDNKFEFAVIETED